MKKVLFLFLLAFTTLGISGCGGSSFKAKQVSFSYENANDDAYADQIPDQTYSERSKKYGYRQDPCTNYGERLAGLYEITNNTKQYMVDTPVLVQLLDSNGKPVEGYYTIMFVTMGPKSTSYGAFEGSVDSVFGLASRGNWETTGEKRDYFDVYSCKVNPDALEHVKDAKGVSIELLSSANAPEEVKNNVPGDIDDKVKDTYQDEPVRKVNGGGSGVGQEWVYNTDISFEDVKGTFMTDDNVHATVDLDGKITATAYNEWGEDIQSIITPLFFVAKEGKEVVGYGMGIWFNRSGFKAGKSGTNIDLPEASGVYVGKSNKLEDLDTELYGAVLTDSPLFSNDPYNKSRR